MYDVVSKDEDFTNIEARGAGAYKICFRNLGSASLMPRISSGPKVYVDLFHFWPTHLLYQEHLVGPVGRGDEGKRVEMASQDDVFDRITEARADRAHAFVNLT